MSKFFNKYFAMKQKFTNLYGAMCMVREKICEAKIFGMNVAFKWNIWY